MHFSHSSWLSAKFPRRSKDSYLRLGYRWIWRICGYSNGIWSKMTCQVKGFVGFGWKSESVKRKKQEPSLNAYTLSWSYMSLTRSYHIYIYIYVPKQRDVDNFEISSWNQSVQDTLRIEVVLTSRLLLDIPTQIETKPLVVPIWSNL